MAEKETLEILLKLQDELSKGINKASKNITGMGSKLDKTSQKLSKMGNSMTAIGKKAAVKFAIMGAAITGVMTIFAGYEKQMSKVKAISGATEKEFAQLQETARSLGATTKFSAKQAGEGMEYLALAGYNTNQTIAAMPGLLNLAAAGQLELGTASDLVTDILSQYGLKAEYATEASDLFAKVQATANTNVELLGSAILAVGGTAKNAGVSLEETASIIGLLADQGLKGQAAGTAMNRMILDMVKKSDKLKEMGINVYDLNGEFRSMADIVEDVEKAIKGKNAQDAMNIKMQVTGIFGQQSLNRLLQAGSDRMREFTTASSDNIGVAKKMADTMEDNLIGQLTILKSALSEAAIAIGEKMAPSIKNLIGLVNKITNAFNALSPETQKFIGQSALIVTAITGIVAVVALLTGTILKLTAVMLANPFGLIVAGVAAVVAASIYLYKNWNTVIGFFQHTFTQLKGWFDGLTQKVIDVSKNIGDIFKTLGKVIFFAMTGKFGKVKESFTQLNEDIRSIMNTGREGIKGDQDIANEEDQVKQEEKNLAELETIAGHNQAKTEQAGVYREETQATKQENDEIDKEAAIKKFDDAIARQRAYDALTTKEEQKKLKFLHSLRGKAGINQTILKTKIENQIKNIDIAYDNEGKKRKAKERAIEKQAYSTALKDGLSAITYFLEQGAEKYRAAAIALKVIRVGEAIMNTWAAAASALATVPFPANIFAVAGVVAKGLAAVASITGVKFAEGAASVPGIGSRDTVPASLTPGEMIVPKSFAESIRAGELSLSGSEEGSGSTEIQVNINNPIFYGEPDIDFVKEIFRIAGEGITENLITPLPEGA